MRGHVFPRRVHGLHVRDSRLRKNIRDDGRSSQLRQIHDVERGECGVLLTQGGGGGSKPDTVPPSDAACQRHTSAHTNTHRDAHKHTDAHTQTHADAHTLVLPGGRILKSCSYSTQQTGISNSTHPKQHKQHDGMPRPLWAHGSFPQHGTAKSRRHTFNTQTHSE